MVTCHAFGHNIKDHITDVSNMIVNSTAGLGTGGFVIARPFDQTYK